MADGATSLLVEVTGRGDEIALRSRGPERKELISVISAELDALNSTYGDLSKAGRVHKWIPCNCRTCEQTIDPHLYEYRNLVQRRSEGKATVECARPGYENVDVLTLVEGLNLSIYPDAERFQHDLADDERRSRNNESHQAIGGGTVAQRVVVNVTNSPGLAPRETGRPSLPDNIAVWSGGGAVVGAVAAGLFGAGRSWDFTENTTWSAITTMAGIGVLFGTAIAFALRLIRRH
jgi:hypothetical protein